MVKFPSVKIYLAGRYSKRELLAAFAKRLEAMGHVVTSRWLTGDHEGGQGTPSGQAAFLDRQRFAREDMEDLYAAQVTISLTEEPRTDKGRGGRHVEFGVALALGHFCIVVGYRENVFHCLDGVAHIQSLDFPDWEILLSDVEELLWKRGTIEAPPADESDIAEGAKLIQELAASPLMEVPGQMSEQEAHLHASNIMREFDGRGGEYAARQHLEQNSPPDSMIGKTITATPIFVPGQPYPLPKVTTVEFSKPGTDELGTPTGAELIDSVLALTPDTDGYLYAAFGPHTQTALKQIREDLFRLEGLDK
jgi:hypothetical protein